MDSNNVLKGTLSQEKKKKRWTLRSCAPRKLKLLKERDDKNKMVVMMVVMVAVMVISNIMISKNHNTNNKMYSFYLKTTKKNCNKILFLKSSDMFNTIVINYWDNIQERPRFQQYASTWSHLSLRLTTKKWSREALFVFLIANWNLRDKNPQYRAWQVWESGKIILWVQTPKSCSEIERNWRKASYYMTFWQISYHLHNEEKLQDFN